MTTPTLIKQLAQETGWSQADIKRAITAADRQVSTKEEILACMIRYAGPALQERSRALSAQKRVNQQYKAKIEKVIQQLEESDTFYAEKMVPRLKDTIKVQAEYIIELLEVTAPHHQKQ